MFPEIEQFEQWLARRSPNASTYIHYISDLKLFFTWADTKPESITVRKVDAFVEHSQECGFAASTINRRLTALSCFYEFLAMEQDDAPKNPVITRRHRINQDERLPRDASDVDVEKLFAVIHTPRDKAMFQLMVGGGLRVGEVRNLSLGDLTLAPEKSDTIQMPRVRVFGKGSSERSVYLSNPTMQSVHDWLAIRPTVPDTAVFLNRFGKRLTVTGIQTCLAGYCEEADIWITCHQLRHTFGRHLVEARVPVTTIQKLMGHAWLQTTQRYMHVSDQQVQDDFRKAIEAISNQVSPKNGIQ
jgi:site-specific recombinase XerD